MVTRIFLGFEAAILIAYGLYCLVAPGALAGSAGVSANSLTGTIELQSMYGGLQTAVGALCALGAIQLGMQRVALVALLFCFAGLAIPRVTLGLMNGDFSGYTIGAMSFESFSALAAYFLLARTRPG